MQQKGIVQKAARAWREIWIPAVLELARNSKKPALQDLLENHKSDETGNLLNKVVNFTYWVRALCFLCFFTDGDKNILHAVKVLVTLYLPKAKKLENTLLHLYEEYEVGNIENRLPFSQIKSVYYFYPRNHTDVNYNGRGGNEGAPTDLSSHCSIQQRQCQTVFPFH